MSDGDLLLLMHAHLPYIRHPEDPHFIEEGWLVEAMSECYIPILHRLERLADEGIAARLTMTWSPPLCEMLDDALRPSPTGPAIGRSLPRFLLHR